MRIALIVVATLFLVAAMGLGGILALRNYSDATKISKITGDLEQLTATAGKDAPAEVKQAKEVLEKVGQLRTGALPALLTGLLALGLLVMQFVKKGVFPIAGAIILAGVLSIVLNPHFDTGPLGPASPRSMAIVLTVLAAIGAGASFGAEMIRRHRLAAASA
jgi:hypothetical protein